MQLESIDSIDSYSLRFISAVYWSAMNGRTLALPAALPFLLPSGRVVYIQNDYLLVVGGRCFGRRQVTDATGPSGSRPK